VGAFLSNGGDAVYFFHYLPLGIHGGCNGSLGTFGLFSTDANLQAEQPLSQYFASQMINLDWVQPGDGAHRLFHAASDIQDAAGHVLVTAYAALRPDGQWSLLIVNKDQENGHTVRIAFDGLKPGGEGRFDGPTKMTTFGSAQYQWHPGTMTGKADPDGPPAHSTIAASPATQYELPAASITVLTGTVRSEK
jgi:hypothetical protein